MNTCSFEFFLNFTDVPIFCKVPNKHLFARRIDTFYWISAWRNWFRSLLIGFESGLAFVTKRITVWLGSYEEDVDCWFGHTRTFGTLIIETTGIRFRQGLQCCQTWISVVDNMTQNQTVVHYVKQVCNFRDKKIAAISHKCEGDEINWDVPKPNENVSIRRAKLRNIMLIMIKCNIMSQIHPLKRFKNIMFCFCVLSEDKCIHLAETKQSSISNVGRSFASLVKWCQDVVYR